MMIPMLKIEITLGTIAMLMERAGKKPITKKQVIVVEMNLATSLYCFHSHSDAKSSAQLLFHKVVLFILLIFCRTRLPSQAVVADNPRLSNTNIHSIQVV